MNKIVLFAILMVILLAGILGKPYITGLFIAPTRVPVASCDPVLWDHVWNSTRLEVIDDCTSVTGTVVSSFETNDGDQHIQLFPDAKYLKLLNKKNIELQLSSLVIEPICSHDPTIINNSTLLDAGVGYADGQIESGSIEACDGFVSDVYIPKVGEHVRITGSYVLDTLHGWMEIHPVTKIEVIKY